MTTASIFVHQILRDDFAERLAEASREWKADKDAYLARMWQRAIDADPEAAKALPPSPEYPPWEGGECDWPDGMQALMVAMDEPYAPGEAIYCGVFFKPGQESKARYVLMEHGAKLSTMTTWHKGKHTSYGPAGAETPGAFATVVKMILSQPQPN